MTRSFCVQLAEIFNIIKELKNEGMTIFLVEQNASQALGAGGRWRPESVS